MRWTDEKKMNHADEGRRQGEKRGQCCPLGGRNEYCIRLQSPLKNNDAFSVNVWRDGDIKIQSLASIPWMEQSNLASCITHTRVINQFYTGVKVLLKCSIDTLKSNKYK